MSSVKYRPSLSMEQINYLLNILQQHQDYQAKEITVQLWKFSQKATLSIIKPSHVTTPKESLESSLGFSSTPSPGQDMSKLLEIYETTPAILSKPQLDLVNHYRYTHDLMTQEEEKAYEQS